MHTYKHNVDYIFNKTKRPIFSRSTSSVGNMCFKASPWNFLTPNIMTFRKYILVLSKFS